MKLNIGASGTELPGFESYDIKDGQNAAVLPYETGSVEEIYASHVFEHFSHKDATRVLAEWVRVLKPGGRIRIAVPNFDWIVREYQTPSRQWNVEGYLMGGHADQHDIHLAVYNETKLRGMMERAGLENIQPWVSEIQDCAALPVSLNLEGTKPSAESVKPRKLHDVTAIMSLPRLAFTDNMFTMMQTMPPLGINVLKTSGVFWGQCMQGMLEDVAAGGSKYVLTVDYDSVFSQADILRLYDLMESHPGIDALIPVQMRRESTFALFTVTDDADKVRGLITLDELQQDVMKVNSGHFGLTMIRCESLRKLSLPWFWGQPDSEGRWTEAKQDDDVFFWRKWKDEGLSVFLAPRVVIGHIQQFVTWPDPVLKPIHQGVSDWYKQGKPKEAMK